MSENEIKPVLWDLTHEVDWDDKEVPGTTQVTPCPDGRFVHVDDYQTAIDRLTAERDAAVADAERWRKWLPWIRGLSRKPFNLAVEIRLIDAARSEGGV